MSLQQPYIIKVFLIKKCIMWYRISLNHFTSEAHSCIVIMSVTILRLKKNYCTIVLLLVFFIIKQLSQIYAYNIEYQCNIINYQFYVCTLKIIVYKIRVKMSFFEICI